MKVRYLSVDQHANFVLCISFETVPSGTASDKRSPVMDVETGAITHVDEVLEY